MTTTTKAQPVEDTADIEPPPLPRTPRGRHRRPRPRKVLFAVGGLAVAAGVLSLVRMVPEGGVGTPGTAEAEPRLDPTADANDRSANAAAPGSNASGPARPRTSTASGAATPAMAARR